MLKFLPTVSNKMALRLLKWSEFFYTFLLILPVIVVLYQNKGITVGDFFLIQGLSSMVAMKPIWFDWCHNNCRSCFFDNVAAVKEGFGYHQAEVSLNVGSLSVQG